MADERKTFDLRRVETRIPTFFGEFKAFLTRSNALALAVGFIVGSATGKVVTAIVDDVFMPLIGLILPSGGWRNARIALGAKVDAEGNPTNAILYGDLIGKAVDFLLIAFVIFVVMKWVLRTLPVATRACPECMEPVPVTARRCRACASALPPLVPVPAPGPQAGTPPPNLGR